MAAVKLQYEGPREQGAADVFYDALCKVFLPQLRAHGLLVYGRSRPTPDADWGPAAIHFQRGFDDSLIREFCDYYHLRNVWAANEPAMPQGEAVTSSMLFPDARLKTTEYWSDWLRPQDIFYAIGGVLVGTGTHQVKASFVRSEGRGAYGDVDLEACRLLIPHLQALWDLQRKIAEVEAAGAAAIANLRSIAEAVFGLDPAGRVRYANDAAERLLRSGSVVKSRWGRLTSEHPRVAAALRSSAATPQVQGVGTHRVAVTGAEALPTAGRDASRLVIVSDTRPSPRPSLVPGLTEAERDVLRMMVAGFRIKQIADQRRSSQHTVRSQVASILHKAGCRSQLELLGRLVTAGGQE